MVIQLLGYHEALDAPTARQSARRCDAPRGRLRANLRSLRCRITALNVAPRRARPCSLLIPVNAWLPPPLGSRERLCVLTAVPAAHSSKGHNTNRSLSSVQLLAKVLQLHNSEECGVRHLVQVTLTGKLSLFFLCVLSTYMSTPVSIASTAYSLSVGLFARQVDPQNNPLPIPGSGYRLCVLAAASCYPFGPSSHFEPYDLYPSRRQEPQQSGPLPICDVTLALKHHPLLPFGSGS